MARSIVTPMFLERLRTSVPSVSPVVKELEKLANAGSLWGHPAGGGKAIYLGPLIWGEPFFEGKICVCKWTTPKMPRALVVGVEMRTRDGKTINQPSTIHAPLPLQTEGRDYLGTFTAQGQSSPAGLMSKVRDVMAGLDFPEEIRR
jgi:hypothetical protein